MTDARVRRGRKSEHLAADYLLPLFPNAHAVAASLPGRDILGTSADDIEFLHGDPVPNPETRGIAPEVKARKAFEPLKAMAQAKRNAGNDIPMVILRMDGQGEESVGDWLAIFTFKEARDLIGRAFNLGEHGRAANQSSPEERNESPGLGSSVRLGSYTNNIGFEVLEETASRFLHDMGILSRDYEVQILRSESGVGQRS